jgi:UDP-N-acetylmuramoylalanine-D-glutamate ligase
LRAPSGFIPSIAVILNITPDHLDRHGTFENYALAKERIFARRRARLPGAERRQRARRRAAARAPRKVYWFSSSSQCAGRLGGGWLRGLSRSKPRRRAVEKIHAAERRFR